MSNPHAPVKTRLGHQELRQRTQHLGQRYRTVLLLVDGRRSVAEVLSMALQAGAQTAHFEELVRLGMVELPVPETVPELPFEEPAAEARIEAVPDFAASAPPAPPPAPRAPPASPAAPAQCDLAPPEPIPASVAAAQEPPPGGEPAAPEPAAPELVATALGEAAIVSAEAKLAEARRLLIETLRRDTLLLRVFAPARVRAAQTQEALIGLVWEIERERSHARRKRGQLLNLQRARELLGMGNTIVAEDSLPLPPPDE